MRETTLDTFYSVDVGGDWVIITPDNRYVTSPNVLDGFVTYNPDHARRFKTERTARNFIAKCAICRDTDRPVKLVKG